MRDDFARHDLKEWNGEADISTEQARAQAAARVPGPDGDRGRTAGHRGAPGARTQEAVCLSLIRLNRRAEPQKPGLLQKTPEKTGERFLSRPSLPPAPRRLKRRADFLRAAAGKRFHTKAFTLQAVRRTPAALSADGGAAEAELLPEPPRLGFTVTKKIGKAVVRNRIRRRFKEAIRLLDPLPARTGHDYVMIARVEALGLAFKSLQADLVRAFSNIDAGNTRAASRPRKSRDRDSAPPARPRGAGPAGSPP